MSNTDLASRIKEQAYTMGRIFKAMEEAVNDRRNYNYTPLALVNHATMFPLQGNTLIQKKVMQNHADTPYLRWVLRILYAKTELEDWIEWGGKALTLEMQGEWQRGYWHGASKIFRDIDMKGENPIAYIRKANGLTQAQLAEQIGVMQHHIAKYETGGVKPRAETLQRLAKALHCEIEDLMPKLNENQTYQIEE